MEDAAGKEEIIREFTGEQDVEALLQDSHGNYVTQNALNLVNDPANLRSSPLTSCAAAFIVQQELELKDVSSFLGVTISQWFGQVHLKHCPMAS